MLDADDFCRPSEIDRGGASTRHPQTEETGHFSEDFLTANANRDFIVAQLTELVRDLIRAVAAVSEGSGGAYRAGERMELETALLARCEDRVSWSSLFSTAVSNLRDWETHHPVDETIL